MSQQRLAASIIKQIDSIKILSAEQQANIETAFVSLLRQLDGLVTQTQQRLTDQENNPLLQFLSQQIKFAINNLNGGKPLLRETLLKVFKFTQSIKKMVRLFFSASAGESDKEQLDTVVSLVENIFSQLTHYFCNLNAASQRDTPLTKEEITSLTDAKLELCEHFNGNKAVYYQDVTLAFQLFQQHYEIMLEEVKVKLNRHSTYRPKDDREKDLTGKLRDKRDYFVYILNSIGNTLIIIKNLIENNVATDLALEQLFCNIIINDNKLLALVQASLHELVSNSLSPDTLSLLSAKKSFYLSEVSGIRNLALLLQFIMLKQALDEASNTAEKTKLLPDLKMAIEVDYAATFERESKYYADQFILTTVELLPKILNKSKSDEHKKSYREGLHALLTILAHPFHLLPSEMLLRLKALLSEPVISRDDLLQRQICRILIDHDNKELRYCAAGYTPEQAIILMSELQASEEFNAWSLEQTQRSELMLVLPTQLATLNTHIKILLNNCRH